VPIIAADCGGNKELIIDGKNGYLVKCDNDKGKRAINIKHLISLIVKILRNKKLNKGLKENARKVAWRYDYHKVLPRLVGLLKKRSLNIKVKNRWNSIRNKRVIDFNHLFNRDFLFFLYYRDRFGPETYASLCRKQAKWVDFKNKDYSASGKTIKKKRTRNKEISDKIRHVFLNFLSPKA